MDKEERPFWLKIQEHGILAEARTRAFLLERFWILERSIDIEGADFIIQRRLTERSLLDRVPPRLGYVQSKYFADFNTTQYVHREYIFDSENKARPEFFLLCHSGKENDATMYFLSSNDIIENFQIAEPEHSKAGCFVLPGKKVLEQRFLLLDRSNVLSRIEQALKNADFIKNRGFLSWALPTLSKQNLPIKEEYIEPINNWWGDISQSFLEMRKTAQRAQFDLEEVLDMLKTIENSDDPAIALEIAEKLYSSFGNNVSIRGDIYNEDFHNAVLYHKTRYKQLKDSGLLNAHSALSRKIKQFIVNDLSPRMPMTKNQVYIIDVNYHSNLMNVNITSKCSEISKQWPTPDSSWDDKDAPTSPGIINAVSGQISAYLLPGHHGYYRWENGKHVKDTRPWKQKLESVAQRVTDDVMDKVLYLRFGEA